MRSAIAVGAVVGFLAGMLGAGGAILGFGWLESGLGDAELSTLFSFAIVGLYLIAIVVGALTLTATLVGRPVFARIAREEAEAHVKAREDQINEAILRYESEALASSFFVAGYVLGELGPTNDDFYRSSTTWSEKAIQQLPDDHRGKLTAKNNYAYYGSRDPAPEDVDKIIEYTKDLRADFPASLDVEYAKTYAAVVLNLAPVRTSLQSWAHDAVLVLETALKSPDISTEDTRKVRAYIGQLRQLQDGA